MEQMQIAERTAADSVLPDQVTPRSAGIELPQLELAAPEKTGDAWDHALCAAILAALSLLIYQSIHGGWFRPIIVDAESYQWGRLVVRPAILWGVMGSLLLGFRTLLWLRYRSAPAATMSDAPSLT